MSCPEMKELEIICTRFAERRAHMATPTTERRNVPTGHRAVQARIAYLMLAHRQSCATCGSKDRAATKFDS